MNRIYRLVWNTSRKQWVVAHERAMACGKAGGKGALVSRVATALVVAAGLHATTVLASGPLSPPAPTTLPQGGVVAAGSAQISTPAANQLQINQGSEQAVINWNSFDIGAQAKVNFTQPDAAASVLNRVLANDPTQIFGQLSANGQVYIVNPNGIVFGAGAQVNAGALVASTLDIADSDFMAGRMNFVRGNATGSISNQGSLNAAPGGYVALLGATVANNGSIHAPGGRAILAAGDSVQLPLQLPLTSSGLITLAVSPATVNAAVSNGADGIISAPNGQVYLSAAAASGLAAQALNQGQISAQGDGKVGGSVTLSATTADNLGETRQQGLIDVSSDSGAGVGGNVTLLGDRVGLFSGSSVLATGAQGGGTVKVGGDAQGHGPDYQAQAVYMDAQASIDASATGGGNGGGNGGSVVLWSQDYTGFYGSIAARGGAQGGNGGQVETSSHSNLQAFGSVDATAPQGRAGNWLLDPTDVTIVTGAVNSSDTDAGGTWTPTTNTAQIGVNNINADLNAGTSVTINTASAGAGTGNITQNAGADIAKTAGGNATLTMTAAGSITLSGNLSSTAGTLATTLNANGGAVSDTGTINTNGGLLTVNAASGTGTITGAISGSGGITKTGAGTLTLNAPVASPNTFSGAIAVNAGTLSVTRDAELGAASSIVMANGTTLSSTGALAASRVVTLTSGTVTLSGFGVGSARFTGAGGATVLAGVTMSNNASDYTGQTQFAGAAGTYSFTSIGDLGVPSSLGAPTTAANGTVLMTAAAGGYTLAYTGSGSSSNRVFNLNESGGLVTLRNAGSGTLTLNGNIVLGGTTGGNPAVTFNAQGGDLALLGTISNGAAARNVIYSGSAGRTITLGGANTYGGGTQITSGVKVQAPVIANGNQASSLGLLFGFNIANAITINTGGILSFTGSAANGVSNRGFQFSGGNGTVSNDGSGALTLSGNMTLGNAATMILAGSYSGAANTASGPVAPAAAGNVGNLVVNTAGNWNLSGTNTYTGTTTVSQGTLSAGSTSAFGSNSAVTLANVAGATLDLAGFSNSIGSLSGGGTTGGNVTLGAGTLSTGGDNTSTSYGGIVSGNGALVKTGTGTQTLTGNSSYLGTTTDSGGTLQVGNGGTTGMLGTGAVTDNANLIFNRSDAYAIPNSMSGSGNLTASSGNNLSINGTVNLGGTVLLTAGVGQPVAAPSVPNGSVTGGDVTLNASVTAGGAGELTIYSGNATTAAYEAEIAGSATSLNKAYATAPGAGAVDASKVLNVFYRVSPTPAVSANANSKVYDATTAATLNAATATASGIEGDVLSITGGSSALGNFNNANVGNGKAVTFSGGSINVIATTSTGQPVSGYQTATTASGSGNITPATLTLTAAANSKTYDGIASAAAIPSVSGLQGSDTVTGLGEAYSNPNAGAGKTLTVNSYMINDGNGGNNYTVSLVNNSSGVITPASLTVTANNDAKFVTQADTPGYAGVSYTGFVNGETAAVLGGSATVTRSNSSVQAAGTYTDVLLASGLTSNNYTISYVPGNYSIVPANELLVKLGTTNSTYGSAANYGIQSAQYLLSNGTIVTLAPTVSNGIVTVNDGVGGVVSFPIVVESPVNSSSGHLATGGYQLGYGTVTGNSADFSNNLVLTGNQTVNPLSVTLAANGVSKIYDGSQSINGMSLGLNGKLAGDAVTASGNGSYASKNAGTGLSYMVSNLALSGADASDYVFSGPTNFSGNNGIITPATLTLTAAANSKTYDGTVGAVAVPSVSGLVGGDSVSGLSEVYSNPNAGSGKTLAVNGYTINDGNGGNNYTVSLVNNNTGTITPASLTVTANNDAKFVTQSDTPGYAGVSYTGFVNGETAAVLGGSATVTRSNSSVQAAGTYTGVLIASGLTSSNYTISYVPGNYSIVPANELLVKLGTTTSTYGSVANYGIQSAQYLLSNGTIVTLAPTVSNGIVTVNDGVGGGVSFPVTVINSRDSSSGNLAAGGYQLGYGAVTGNSTDFSNNLVVTGNQTVNPLTVTLAANGVSKGYDGTTAMNGISLSLNGELAGDVVTASGSGSFASKNVGTNLSYTVSNLALSGPDALDYVVSGNTNTYSGNNGTITPATLTLMAAPNGKTYDGTVSAASLPTVSGLQRGDSVSGLSEAYTDPNAGAGKTLVVGMGYVINDGNGGRNYIVNVVDTNTGTITQAVLTITATANSKTYDTTTAAGAIPTVSGLLGNDTVSGLSEAYLDPNAGAGKTLVVNAGYVINDGHGGGNYTVNVVDTATGAITPAVLTLTAAPNSKTYDATINAAAIPTVSGLLGSDTVSGLSESYAGKNTGNGKTLTVTGYVVDDGNGGHNYSVDLVANNNGVITAAPLTITAAPNSKVYDTTTAAAATPTMSGLMGGDSATASEAYDNKNAGNGKTLTVTGYTVNDGNGGNNYIVSTVSNTQGVITPAPITVGAPEFISKPYDGTTAVPANTVPLILSGGLGEGLLSGTLSYATPSVGSGKTVNLSNVVMNDGNGGHNYIVTLRPSTSGSIVPLPPSPRTEIERDMPDGPVEVTLWMESCADGCAIQLSDLRAQLPDICGIAAVDGAPEGTGYDPASGQLRFAAQRQRETTRTVTARSFDCSGKPRDVRIHLVASETNPRL